MESVRIPVSKSLFVWHDVKRFSTMENHQFVWYKEFVDGKEIPSHTFKHPLRWGSTCDSCGEENYIDGDLSGLTKRFECYRARGGDLWASHGNVTIEEQKVRYCPFCGFAFRVESSTSGTNREADWFDLTYTLLRSLNINDAELGMKDLAAHILRQDDDVYHIHPTRFEQLLESAYTNLGYRVVRTQATHDGGYDLQLFSNGDEEILVECKRWKNTVGIKIVRELTGVLFSLGKNRGCIVTPSGFSRAAYEFTETTADRHPGFEIELVQLQHLLNDLRVYNTALPPLDILEKMGEERARALIIEYSSSRLDLHD